MSELLPHNATPQERALDGATARVGDVPVVVREVWDPDTCPAALLPWLAWALSVDLWDPAWTDDQKRDAIRHSIAVQRRKGTVGAVRDALASVDLAARVLEWHRNSTPGDPFTYDLFIEARRDAPVRSIGQIRQAIEAVDRTKSLRSHMGHAQISVATEAGPYRAAAAVCGHEIVVGSVPRGPIELNAVLGTACHYAKTITIQPKSAEGSPPVVPVELNAVLGTGYHYAKTITIQPRST